MQLVLILEMSQYFLLGVDLVNQRLVHFHVQLIHPRLDVKPEHVEVLEISGNVVALRVLFWSDAARLLQLEREIITHLICFGFDSRYLRQKKQL